MTLAQSAARPTRADVERLQRFHLGGTQVLSTYLDLEPERQLQRAYQIVFKDLIKEASEPLDKRGRDELAGEAARVQQWLDAQPPDGLGLAVFSAGKAGLWEAHWLTVRVPDRVSFGPRPLLRPLLELIDDYERYAIASVDKKNARIFSVYMGVIEVVDDFEDFVPGKHDQGGWSQANYQRHHEAHVQNHLRRVVDRLSRLLRQRPFDRLIVAGPDEATAELRRLWPSDLEERHVATIPADDAPGDAEILARTLEVERRVEREGENQLVDAVLEVAPAGGRAVCGLDATLVALWLGEVRTIVVAADTVRLGCECPVDGRLVAGPVTVCPACNTVMTPLDDVIERALEQTLARDGDVEIVHDEAAGRLIESCDGLAAALRFRALV